MFIPLFLCIGFFIAIAYTDLVFDISALPYRGSKANLPGHILDPIVTYYRYITKNPWLLVFCMLTATICVIAQIWFHQVPKGVGYASISMIGVVLLFTSLQVIPAAQRIASRKDAEEKLTRLVHSLFPSHIIIMILILSLALLQFNAATR